MRIMSEFERLNWTSRERQIQIALANSSFTRVNHFQLIKFMDDSSNPGHAEWMHRRRVVFFEENKNHHR